MIRNCIIQAVAFGIMCEFPKNILNLSYILSNNIRLDLQLCNSGPIVTRTSLVAAVSVPELAWEPSLNSGLTALKVLCRGSLKGRLRGGPPRRLFLYSTQHLGKTSDFSWCARRVHLSTGHTYQPDSPIGLDLELLKRALKEPPKTPSE